MQKAQNLHPSDFLTNTIDHNKGRARNDEFARSVNSSGPADLGLIDEQIRLALDLVKVAYRGAEILIGDKLYCSLAI